MFEMRPESVKTFINDRTIKLPRFQRKQTWGFQKNFRFCVSVFKDFPLGLIVLKLEKGKKSGSQLEKWLLDGRQRRNALSRMPNPEEIYVWARSALRLKAKAMSDEVSDAFWDFIREYLEENEWISAEEEEAQPNVPVDSSPDEFTADPEDELSDDEEIEDASSGSEPQRLEAPDDDATASETKETDSYRNLRELLELLLLVHPKKRRSSGLTWPFDFKKEIPDLEFLKQDQLTGRTYVESEALLAWMDARKQIDRINHKEFPPTADGFYEWLVPPPKQMTNASKIKTRIAQRWEPIKKVLLALDRLDTHLQETKIGILELKDCTDNDAKKIFEIINTEGTKLTAAEILSAKPSWNRVVDEPDPSIIRDKDSLYREIGVSNTELVLWDIPATLLDRLKVDYILGGKP